MDWEIFNCLVVVALFITFAWLVCLFIRLLEKIEFDDAWLGKRLVYMRLGDDTNAAFNLSRPHLLTLLRASRDSTASKLPKVAVPFRLRLNEESKPKVEKRAGGQKSLVLSLDSILDFQVDFFWGVKSNVFDTLELPGGLSAFQSISESLSTVSKSLSLLHSVRNDRGGTLSHRKVSPRTQSEARPSRSFLSWAEAKTLEVLEKNAERTSSSTRMSPGKRKVCEAPLPPGFLKSDDTTAVVVVSRTQSQKRLSWR